MLNEWSDRLQPRDAAEFWKRSAQEATDHRTDKVARELHTAVKRDGAPPQGFYDAMRHFLTLRDKIFPHMPADPAWKILVTLAQTPAGSPKASLSGITHGADVPMTTALRYIAVMESEGIVTRIPHPLDRRQVMIELTDEGRRKLDAIAEQWATRLFLLAMPLAFIYLAYTAWI